MTFFAQVQNLFSRWKTEIQWAIFGTVSAYFLAQAINLSIASLYFPLEVNFENTSFRSRSGLELRSLRIAQIRQRNLFDSTAKEPQARPEPTLIDPTELVKSTINADLLATIVFENPQFSVALIQDKSKNEKSYYSLGDQIQNATISKIERFRVILRRSGRMEYLDVQGSQIDLEPSPSSPFTRPTRSRPSSEGIRQTREGGYEIQGRYLDGLLSDLPSLLRGALAQPFTVGNQIEGFRITRIQPDSVYEKLGLEDGDIIKAINGDKLDSPQKGMQLFSTLRDQKRISIDIERNGSRLNYTYDIR